LWIDPRAIFLWITIIYPRAGNYLYTNTDVSLEHDTAEISGVKKRVSSIVLEYLINASEKKRTLELFSSEKYEDILISTFVQTIRYDMQVWDDADEGNGNSAWKISLGHQSLSSFFRSPFPLITTSVLPKEFHYYPTS